MSAAFGFDLPSVSLELSAAGLLGLVCAFGPFSCDISAGILPFSCDFKRGCSFDLSLDRFESDLSAVLLEASPALVASLARRPPPGEGAGGLEEEEELCEGFLGSLSERDLGLA